MPGLIYAATKKIAESEDHEQNLLEMQKIRDEIRRSNQRTALTIAGTGLIMAALIVYGLDGFTPAIVGGAPLISWVVGGVGAFILFASFQD
jgi:ubiquinone biosynthesis protein